jgi:hypothetical protein
VVRSRQVETLVSKVQMVTATKGRTTRYWAAAASRKQAITLVRKLLSPDWNASCAATLTADEAAPLRLRANGVCKIRMRRDGQP